METSQPNTVRVYAAGGGASNVMCELEPSRSSESPGFAKMDSCYIDTSNSNLRNKKIDPNHIFLFEGLDGSGKERAANYEEITKNTLAILQRFKPSKFNIVLHTAAGGSGAVIGPVLVSELKKRGEMVIVIVIGSTDTRIEIENTIKTLKSYESIAILHKSPVVVHYVENTVKSSRHEVNRDVKSSITLLLGLFSGCNTELDTADLKNWLEYTKFSNTPAQLASLNFITDQSDIDSVGHIVSVATLANPTMNTRLNSTPAYQAVGFVPSEWTVGVSNSMQLIDKDPIHFAISSDFISRANSDLTKTLKEVDERFAAQVNRSSIVSKDDNATHIGVVL
jgi:hypothetical protein